MSAGAGGGDPSTDGAAAAAGASDSVRVRVRVAPGRRQAQRRCGEEGMGKEETRRGQGVRPVGWLAPLYRCA